MVFLDPYQDTPAFTTSNRNTQGDSSVKWQKTKADDDGTANHSYISITAMKEYAKTSFDELRVQEYVLNSSKIFAVGRWVRATVTFTSNDKNANEVPEGSLGKNASFNKNGDAWIDFEGLNAQLRVFKRNFGNISVLLQEDVLKERAGAARRAGAWRLLLSGKSCTASLRLPHSGHFNVCLERKTWSHSICCAPGKCAGKSANKRATPVAHSQKYSL